MSNHSVKEAASFETEESLSRVFETFDKIELGHSQSDFSEAKPGFYFSDKSNQEDHQQDVFKKIIQWFEHKKILPGCPETIEHSFECKQKSSIKPQENPLGKSLTGSAIILRRSKRWQKEGSMH